MISVIIPAYNAEKTIGKCLYSLINQKYNDYEVIVVNDGSIDNTLTVCKEISINEPKITVIDQANSGAMMARREGAKNATGEYLLFVDADDWVSESYVHDFVCLIEKSHADIIATGCIRHDIDGEEIFESNCIPCGYYEADDYLKIKKQLLYYGGFFEFGILPYLWNKAFIREKFLECTKDIDVSIYNGEDVAAIVAYLVEANNIYIANSYNYHYMYVDNSLSHKKETSYYNNVASIYHYLYTKVHLTNETDIWLPQINQYMRFMVWKERPELFILSNKFIFPFDQVEMGSRVVLYGAGLVGKTYFHQLSTLDYCELVGWLDRDYEIIKKVYSFKINAPETIVKLNYDKLIIAIDDKRIKKLVRKQLESLGAKNII